VSIERKSGVVWRVRWRENDQPHSRVLGSKRDAELFEADIKRRKRLGQLAQIDASRETIAELAHEWWRIHAEPNAERMPAEAAIRAARAADVSVCVRRRRRVGRCPTKTPAFPASRRPDSNRGPLHYERHQRLKRLMVRGHERDVFARPAGVSR